MIDIGSGPAVVMIPGIQGRWEWMRPAVDALARRCRVITFSFPGEPDSGAAQDPARSLESFVRQVDDALDRASVTRAAICGVSFGGLIAVRYAARRVDRVAALVLVSALGPRWQPDERSRACMRAPRLMAPWFFGGALGRLAPELRATFPGIGERLSFGLRSFRQLIAAPASPRRMSLRAEAAADSVVGDCARIEAPTLVLTGERELDRVVPVDATQEYVKMIAGARAAVLENTGHLGLVTRPDRFAEIVADFVATSQSMPARNTKDTVSFEDLLQDFPVTTPGERP